MSYLCPPKIHQFQDGFKLKMATREEATIPDGFESLPPFGGTSPGVGSSPRDHVALTPAFGAGHIITGQEIS